MREKRCRLLVDELEVVQWIADVVEERQKHSVEVEEEALVSGMNRRYW